MIIFLIEQIKINLKRFMSLDVRINKIKRDSNNKIAKFYMYTKKILDLFNYLLDVLKLIRELKKRITKR